MDDHSNSIKRQFLNSLKRGTGEAYIILRQHSHIDFSDLIIKGAITNFAYDQQCEGSRAKYIYRLIKNTKQKDKIINAVLTELQVEKTDYWGLSQMCDLAVLLFKAGHLEAKTALYNRFEKNTLDDYEFCGQDQLMEIEGINGVLKVAETIGKKILKEDDWEDSWHIDRFQKKNKKVAIYNVLEEAGKKSKFINAYYKSILANKWTLPKHRKITKFSYQLIKEKIDSNTFRFISTDRANDLSLDEVKKLATEALEEKNKQRQDQYLCFFTKRKFPFGYQALLKIANEKNPPKTRLVEHAVDSLEFFEAEDIRQFALDKLSFLKNPCSYINLLVSNYKDGDDKLLSEIANRSDNYDFIHSIACSFIKIYRANPTKKCKDPLEIIYNKMNCGLCREDLIKILADNNVLSEKIYDELEFDSYEGVRKLYRQIKKGK